MSWKETRCPQGDVFNTEKREGELEHCPECNATFRVLHYVRPKVVTFCFPCPRCKKNQLSNALMMGRTTECDGCYKEIHVPRQSAERLAELAENRDGCPLTAAVFLLVIGGLIGVISSLL